MSLDKESFAKALEADRRRALLHKLMQDEEDFGIPLAGYFDEEDEVKPDKK